MARLCALAIGHTRQVLIAAGVVFALAVLAGTPVVFILKTESSDFQDPAAQSQQALRLIERATGQSASYGVAALVPSSADVLAHPAQARDAQRVASLLEAQPGFQRVLDYPATHLAALVSREGRQTLVLAAFATPELSGDAVDHVRSELAGSGVRFGGNEIAFSELNKRTTSDLKRAETLAFPILLVLSFLVFRGLVAAMLPLLVGGFAIVITFLVLRLIDQVAGLSIFAVNLVTGLGLGLGIDYSLFVLSRYREELAGGADAHTAIARTLQTAGRTVLYSALTVAGALSCLLVFPLRFLYSMGIGGALVALSAGAAALIVLPAVLVALGPRINALAPTRLQRGAARAGQSSAAPSGPSSAAPAGPSSAAPAGPSSAAPAAPSSAAPAGRASTAQSSEGGIWFSLARAVMRRPGLVALATGAALVAVALPSLRLALTPADARVLPSSAQPRQVAEAITHDFSVDGSSTITMVVRAPPGGAQTLVGLARRAQQTAGEQASVGASRYLGRGVWEIELLPRASDSVGAKQLLVKRLRALAGPSTLLVGGSSASFVDQKAAIAARTPLALLILALITGGFLFLMSGSLVLPLVALAMNLLTVAVAAGLLVLIFQDGHFSSLLGFTPVGGLEEANLVLLFVVAFALSTDYGVFLFARIKEGHDDGRCTRDAVAYGLERTGRLITAAALLLCVAFGAFVTSQVFFIKQLGAGAVLAVAIDATVVRALLAPALIARLGERTWWAPRQLRRLHALVGVREGGLGGAHA